VEWRASNVERSGSDMEQRGSNVKLTGSDIERRVSDMEQRASDVERKVGREASDFNRREVGGALTMEQWAEGLQQSGGSPT
jgi:hypothetical protein